MEIKTSQNSRLSDLTESPVAPEKSRPLRRNSIQKNRNSQITSWRLGILLSALGKVGLLVLMAFFVISVIRHAYTSEKFDIRTIVFHGCKQTNVQELERTIRTGFSANILRIDLKALRARLEQEPWTKRVEIRRILPSGLVVYIQERVPSVILELRGELMLADDEGVLLDRYDPKYGKLDLPVFKGFLGDTIEGYRQNHAENAFRVMLGVRMLAELEAGSPAFTRSISEVDLSDKSNVKLLLVDDTAEVMLGDRDFLKRFQTFVSNMPQYQDLKSQYSGITSVDLRYDGRIIYRPRGVSGTQPEEKIQISRP